MLQGEPHSLSLELDGLEISKLLKSPCVVGGRRGRCRLQLPDNWYNDFSGFLVCAAYDDPNLVTLHISMKQEMGGSSSTIDYVVWKDGLAKVTWAVYVSFASLRNTVWWDQTSTLVSFSTHPCVSSQCVTLIRKGTPTETTNSYDYEQNFRILRDSKYDLEIVFNSLI